MTPPLPAHAQELRRRIASRHAVVGVVGLGSIGLPATAAMVDAGFSVLGFDTDASRVARLNRGETHLQHLGPDLVSRLRATRRFEASADPARLGEPDAVLVCVPTPLDEQREPDLQHVRGTAEALAARLRPGQLVVLESTTYPGTTRDVVLPILARSGLSCGTEVFLAYAPERVDPGRRGDPRRTPRLVGAVDEASLAVAVALYEPTVDRVVATSCAEVAEAAKLLENVYRAVNIALVNEAKVLFTTMGLDVHEVIDAAATKPFGYEPFRPGPGLGGHCIPIDPFYLAYRARQVGRPARFVELAGEVNRSMPEWVVARTAEALTARGVSVPGARILVLGLAYKPDVDDVRESPAFVVMAQLEQRGAAVDYHDSHVPQMRPVPQFGLAPRRSVSLDEASVAAYDAVVLVTDHSDLDLALIGRAARIVVDTRGAMRNLPGARVVIA